LTHQLTASNTLTTTIQVGSATFFNKPQVSK
jgi:hypothetical protein